MFVFLHWTFGIETKDESALDESECCAVVVVDQYQKRHCSH